MAFVRAAASVGGAGLSRDAFVEVCRTALHLDLTPTELARIFDNVTDHEGTRLLSFECFVRTVRQRFFLRGIRRVMRLRGIHGLPQNYDLELSTCENYRCDFADFQGPFAEIRATRDHAYHGLYTVERQRWQDSVLETVVQRTDPQARPRLVFTCGAMGVGKSHALGWMSSQGIFPLENIVHIDPDHFKQAMPEWRAYVERARILGEPEIPGTLCHRESCYLQEIALEESLRRAQNIWVDGSLRNAKWFVKVFQDIRERFPAYRIALFQVTAPEETIRKRIAERARRSGRAIPETLLKLSMDAVEHSVMTLLPHADFLANIDNSGEVPQLRYFATLDRSGDWSGLGARFAQRSPAPAEFPSRLAPIFIGRVDSCHLELEGCLRCTCDGCSAGQSGVLVVQGQQHSVTLSPAWGVTLYGEAREVARVPEDAALVAWIHPPSDVDVDEVGVELGVAERSLLLFGGFAFFDLDERLVGINAAMGERSGERPFVVQFGPPQHVRAEETAALAIARWAPVALPHLQAGGAKRFAFLTPSEKLASRRISANSGLIFELESARAGKAPTCVFFPILKALA